jgi:anaerobic magnesium-protoporphyrin IX monomethyl ester cyclase
MKVLLLNPSSRGTFRLLNMLLPPLGILYIAAATRDRGNEVAVMDRSVTHGKIDFASYDVVGIHSDTTRFYRALNLARRAKAAGARVVMGGPHPCFASEDILKTGCVDAIVKGEGERSFPDLLDAWRNGSDPTAIPGLIFPDHNGIVDTGQPKRIQDVDSLPLPARDLIDLSQYNRSRLGYRPITSVHTSRGCPYGCRFCSSTRFDGAKWRARSAESVLDELDHLANDLGYGAVSFMDDNFTGSQDRIHEICNGILEKGLDIHWWCFCRADAIVRHPEMVQHMAQAGARMIFMGVETPSPTLLERFHKGTRPDQAREAALILRKNGIQTIASYILGAPEEIREDMRATIRFARELNTETAQFTLLTPYPGTELYEELRDKIIETDWSKFDAVHSVFRHPRIPRTEMHWWLIWAYVSFYLRHGKSIRDLFRFLSNRRYGAQIASQAISAARQ